MSKLILFTGQSAGNALFATWPGGVNAADDTYVWNGSAWVSPAGNGIANYCNLLKALTGEPIYAVNACVDGLPLLGSVSWTSTASGCAIDNAIAKTQAALATLPTGTILDRIEFWGCQSDCIWPAQPDMYGGVKSGLANVLSRFRTGLGSDFRFCVWPVGSVSGGSMTQVVRAQIDFSTDAASFTLGVEPGPASYERLYSDQNHLLDGAQYGVMGRRGALNAASYFVAKANNALSEPHYGAGPRITGISRGGAANRLLVDVRAKNGFGLSTGNPWGSASNVLAGFGMWWGEGSGAQLNVISTHLLGSIIAIDADQGLTWKCRVANQWERALPATACVYDTLGMPLLQHTSEMLVSN